MKSLSVTDRQVEILTLLYRFRFLDRHHIQKFLGHKQPRRTNSWLKDLSEKKLVGRIYSKKFGENTKPAIYFLNLKARQVLKEQKDVNKSLLNRIYREKSRSKRFIDHSLFLADIYHYLKIAASEYKAKLHFFTKTDLAGHNYLPEPMPDLYIAVEEKGLMRRYFLEAFPEGTPRYALRHRIFRYFNYYESNVWEMTTKHLFPKILLVCPNRKMQGFLNKFIKETAEEEFDDSIQFFLTTTKKINKSGMKKEVWQKVEYE